MHRFSIFQVAAVIATAGEALYVAENPWNTASVLLKSSSSSKQAMAVQDVTDEGVSSHLDIMAADVPCSPPSNEQPQKKQPSKLRRQQVCSLDRSWYKQIPPNAQEQGQQPHQIFNPDDTDNNPYGADANDPSAIDSSNYFDNFGLCNPLLVGKNRKYPVCDSGKMRERLIFMGRIDHVKNIMAGGVYVHFDITPVPSLFGCLGSSITWCCESIGVRKSGDLNVPMKFWASDCVAIKGMGVIPEETGPLVH